MNIPDPEWWKKTIIELRNNAGNPFEWIKVVHGHESGTTDTKWLTILSRINWSPVTAYGLLLKGVQEWVHNVFQYNTLIGRFDKMHLNSHDWKK